MSSNLFWAALVLLAAAHGLIWAIIKPTIRGNRHQEEPCRPAE